MIGFMNPHKLVVKKNAFKTFSSAWNENEWWNKKWKVETSIFTSGKGFEFTRDV